MLIPVGRMPYGWRWLILGGVLLIVIMGVIIGSLAPVRAWINCSVLDPLSHWPMGGSYSCYTALAVQNSDSVFCNYIPYYKAERFDCYMQFALTTNDISFCAKIASGSTKQACYESAHIAHRVPTVVCDQVQQRYASLCFDKLAPN